MTPQQALTVLELLAREAADETAAHCDIDDALRVLLPLVVTEATACQD